MRQKSETKFGRCRLCLQNAELTFEHSPPKSRFNNRQVLLIPSSAISAFAKGEISADELAKGREQQKAVGGYWLCETCNGFLSSQYVQAFKFVSMAAMGAAQKALLERESEVRIEVVTWPGSFVRLVLALFVAQTPLQFGKHLATVRELINNPEQPADLETLDFKVYGTFAMGRSSRFTDSLQGTLRGHEHGWTQSLYQEQGFPPFAFALSFDGKESPFEGWQDLTPLLERVRSGPKEALVIQGPIQNADFGLIPTVLSS